MVERFIAGPERKSKLKIIMDDMTIKASLENRKVRSSMYASDYGQCLRKCWFQFFPDEYPQEVHSPRLLRIFANGNDVHERLGGYLKMQDDIEFRDELNVPRDELDVHGRCDGICVIDGAAMIVEFKSINAKTVTEPKEEHIGQLTWYMEMFRTLRGQLKEDFGFKIDDDVGEADLVGVTSLSGRTLEDLTHVDKWLLFTQGEIRGEIIYESKQTQETHHFPLDYDSTRSAKVRLWFEQLNYHVKTKTRPEVMYTKSKYPCVWGNPSDPNNRCAYYNLCWPEQD